MDGPGRIDRLYNKDGIRHVGPSGMTAISRWQSNCWASIRERTAVSNAVPWTMKDGKQNRNPDGQLIECAKRFWSDIMPELSIAEGLELVITVGKVARQVMEAGNLSGAFTLLPLASSSTNLFGRVAWLFDAQDLARYPEGKSIVFRYFPTPTAPTVLFACHVLSMKVKYATRLEARAHRSAS